MPSLDPQPWHTLPFIPSTDSLKITPAMARIEVYLWQKETGRVLPPFFFYIFGSSLPVLTHPNHPFALWDLIEWAERLWALPFFERPFSQYYVPDRLLLAWKRDTLATYEFPDSGYNGMLTFRDAKRFFYAEVLAILDQLSLHIHPSQREDHFYGVRNQWRTVFADPAYDGHLLKPKEGSNV